MTCSRCGQHNRVEARFCDACGASLSLPGESAITSDENQPDAPFTDRVLTLGGVLLAAVGILMLATTDPTPGVVRTGLLVLMLGAALFGAGAVALPSRRCEARHVAVTSPARLLTTRPPQLAAGVGALAFVTLVVRLLLGSTAGLDLLLWLVALAAWAMALGCRVGPLRLSADHWTEVGAVALLVGSFVALNSRDLNDAVYSAIGDEYAFYNSAREILEHGVSRPFSQAGVYDAHPVMNSLYQALVMAVVGADHFGWLFSSVVSVAVAIPAVYLIGRTLADRAVAIVAACLFAFSHYLFAFAHVGKNNINALAPTVWAVALFLVARRRRSTPFLYAAGVAIGLGFYTLYSARATLPILLLFLLTRPGWREHWPKQWREDVCGLWPLGLGFVATAGPIFAASGTAVITRMFAETPVGYSVEVGGPPLRHILTNVTTNLPAFFYNTDTNHYVSGALLDPLTGVLAALGLGLAVRHWSYEPFRLLLAWAAVAVLATGVLSPYPSTAITRLHFVLPPLVLLAAFAWRRLWWPLPTPTTGSVQRWAEPGVIAMLALVVLGLNAQRFWVDSPKRLHLTPEAVAIGAVQSPLCGPEPARTVIVMRATEPLLTPALASLYPHGGMPRMLNQATLQPGRPISLDDARCVVFGNPMDAPAQAALDDLRRAYPTGQIVSFTGRVGSESVTIFSPTT